MAESSAATAITEHRTPRNHLVFPFNIGFLFSQIRSTKSHEITLNQFSFVSCVFVDRVYRFRLQLQSLSINPVLGTGWAATGLLNGSCSSALITASTGTASATSRT